MVKLSITRPRMHWLDYTMPTRRGLDYHIVLDGVRIRSIGPGETIELYLTRGHHEVRARSTFSEANPSKSTAPRARRGASLSTPVPAGKN